MLQHIGIGDAYGACFEGADHSFVQRNNELDDMAYTDHPRKRKKRPNDFNPSLVKNGFYTDDTQMSLAIAEAMLDEDEPWTKESLAERFVEVFQRDQRRGYTTYFLNVLLNSHTGAEMLSKIGGASTKSGAAMRAGVLGLYSDFREIVNKAKIQASVTHDSWIGKNSAVGAALMTHYFYHDLGPKDELSGWLRDNYFSDTIHSPHPMDVDGEVLSCWSPSDGKRVRCHGWDCLEAAIYAIESADSMTKILWQCVDYGGDVDTVAAIAMGPASCCEEIEQDLFVLEEGFENGKFGNDYLKLLDSKLFERFPKGAEK